MDWRLFDMTLFNRKQAADTQVISRRIEPSEQSTYVEIPFEMPELVEDITVEMNVESFGEGQSVIDLGIRDAYQLRGWSGGARTSFRLGMERATPGYIPGKIEAGDWAVVHNAYKVPSGGCVVTVTIQFHYKTYRWLTGDLHTHTVHSDGTYTLEEAADIMESLGCDFIAMTDHNTYSQNLAYPRNRELLMIPGTEFTTNFGHSNFLGVVQPMDDFRVKTAEDVRQKLLTARERGARIVLNHPHCSHCPWEWGFDVDYDWVEVWNGPWTPHNHATVKWWQSELAAGKRTVAVGGSDVHRPEKYRKHAMPCNWVWTNEKSAQGVFDGIAKGRNMISYKSDGPIVSLRCGSYMMGDAVPKQEGNRTVDMVFQQLEAGDQVIIYNEAGEAHKEVIAEDGSHSYAFEAGSSRFVRVEVWRYIQEVDLTIMAMLSNPIYFE